MKTHVALARSGAARGPVTTGSRGRSRSEGAEPQKDIA